MDEVIGDTQGLADRGPQPVDRSASGQSYESGFGPGSFDYDTEDHQAEDMAEMAAAIDRLRVIRARLAIEEAEHATAQASNDIVHELELAHQAVLDAELHDHGGILAVAARRRLARARAAEQTLLDQVGYTSFVEYVLTEPTVLAVAFEGGVEGARAELARIEIDLRDRTPVTSQD